MDAAFIMKMHAHLLAALLGLLYSVSSRASYRPHNFDRWTKQLHYFCFDENCFPLWLQSGGPSVVYLSSVCNVVAL